MQRLMLAETVFFCKRQKKFKKVNMKFITPINITLGCPYINLKFPRSLCNSLLNNITTLAELSDACVLQGQHLITVAH